jgi:hypothetical protein
VPSSDVFVSRRAAVVTVAAATVTTMAGCTSTGAGRSAGRSRPSDTAKPDPDVALAAVALRRERAMLQRVIATVHAHPGLADVLAGTRATHHAHVELLARAVADHTASPTPKPTGDGDPRHAVPRGSDAALAALARQEVRLAELGRQSALAARSGAFARVLASAAAAAAQQVPGLTAAAGTHR